RFPAEAGFLHSPSRSHAFALSLSGDSNLTRSAFRSVSGPEFESDGLWIGLCLSADPTLSEQFDWMNQVSCLKEKNRLALRGNTSSVRAR
ncbi:hypothetical protein, partial [Streptomyces nitrosporeus]|uniref:hypothetical protein n=1 Tax=Streptomyces nitrosporeus TaxID=28894 RepID=UPI00331A4475